MLTIKDLHTIKKYLKLDAIFKEAGVRCDTMRSRMRLGIEIPAEDERRIRSKVKSAIRKIEKTL